MIDLHMHTDFSDGEETVEELLDNCHKANLSIISITDHNTVKVYEKLKKLNISKIYKGKIIKGVELDSIVDGRAVELLVYDFDTDKIKNWIETAYKSRTERQIITFNAAIQKCKDHNMILNTDLSWNPEKEYAHEAIFRMLMYYDQNKTNPDLQFDTYRDFYRTISTNKSHPLYLDLSIAYPSIEDIVKEAKEANGKVFLAHLFHYDFDNFEAFLDDLFKNHKIDGLEVYHYSYTNDQIDWLIDYCHRNNLLMSGGSDYHGIKARTTRLGVGNGNYKISADLISDWYK